MELSQMQVKLALVGQPRSGTSMMMRVLEMGGVDCEYDEFKPIDIMTKFRNIHGFFEVKIPTFTKCFKAWNHQVVSQIPKDWKIIYIERDVDEMVESWKQIQNREMDMPKVRQRILYNRGLIKDLLKDRDVLELKYEEIQENSELEMDKIKAFIGTGFNKGKALNAIDKQLYVKRLAKKNPPVVDTQ